MIYLYSDEQEGAELLFKSTSFQKAKLVVNKALLSENDFWKKAINRFNNNPEKFLKALTQQQLTNLKINYKKLIK